MAKRLDKKREGKIYQWCPLCQQESMIYCQEINAWQCEICGFTNYAEVKHEKNKKN